MSVTARRTDGELPAGLSVAQFLAWMKDTPGRFELHDGQVVAMAPERIGNVAVKGNVFRALGDAITRAGLTCHALPDGAAVHISDDRWYEPDALVYCGPRAPSEDVAIKSPVIVVEVISPSTAQFDETRKLIGYFSVPSVEHYLIVYPEGLPIVHHRRQGDGTILTTLVSGGTLKLDPPGLAFDVAEIFA